MNRSLVRGGWLILTTQFLKDIPVPSRLNFLIQPRRLDPDPALSGKTQNDQPREDENH
jgi:hypothetical protein